MLRIKGKGPGHRVVLQKFNPLDVSTEHLQAALIDCSIYFQTKKPFKKLEQTTVENKIAFLK